MASFVKVIVMGIDVYPQDLLSNSSPSLSRIITQSDVHESDCISNVENSMSTD